MIPLKVMILIRRVGGLEWKERVVVRDATFGCVVPSFGLPSLQGRLAYVWQPGETHLGPIFTT